MLLKSNVPVHDMQGSPPSERVAGCFFVASAPLAYGKRKEPAPHRLYCTESKSLAYASRQNSGNAEPLQPQKTMDNHHLRLYNEYRLLQRHPIMKTNSEVHIDRELNAASYKCSCLNRPGPAAPRGGRDLTAAFIVLHCRQLVWRSS